MSTPAGQSLEHALQLRHRSSTSRTSGARQPCVTSAPLAISWSTRARPLVESFSSRVARYDGHMKPSSGRGVRTALAHPDAAVHGSGEIAVVVAEGEPLAAPQRGGERPAQVGVQRSRTHHDARVEHVGRVEEVLDRTEQRDHLRRVHRREQLAAGPAVAVLAGQRAAVRDDQRRGLLQEGAEARHVGVRAPAAGPGARARSRRRSARRAARRRRARPSAPRTRAGRRRAARAAPRRPPSPATPARRPGCARPGRHRRPGSATWRWPLGRAAARAPPRCRRRRPPRARGPAPRPTWPHPSRPSATRRRAAARGRRRRGGGPPRRGARPAPPPRAGRARGAPAPRRPRPPCPGSRAPRPLRRPPPAPGRQSRRAP